MHDFWNQESPEARQAEMINFAKNAALLGAALALAGVEEPWPLAIPASRSEEHAGTKRQPQRYPTCASGRIAA